MGTGICTVEFGQHGRYSALSALSLELELERGSLLAPPAPHPILTRNSLAQLLASAPREHLPETLLQNVNKIWKSFDR
jgi:hypothetical protein